MFILTPISRSRVFGQSDAMLIIVWDTQTGVTIGEVATQHYGKIFFHGNQRTMTLIQQNQHFYTYDVFNWSNLCQGEILSPQNSGLGAHWTHNDTLQFVTGPGTSGELVIYEIQPSQIPTLHTVSSFSISLPFQVPPPQPLFGISPQYMNFSPVSFHASFSNGEEVVVFDVQNPKLLLQIKVDKTYFPSSGEFSPDGHFFACRTSEQEICVWQNTPTSYELWGSLRPRLLFKEFSWSPTSTSILCWGSGGIQLLHPNNCPNLPSLDKLEGHDHHPHTNHLVTYSTNGTHIATAWRGCSVVTVFDCLSGSPQKFTNMSMGVQDIKIVDNTIFAVDRRKLIGWNFRPGGMVHDPCDAGEAIFNKTLAIDMGAKHLALSHDCFELAFTVHRRTSIFLHNIETQGGSYRDAGYEIKNIRFSPDNCQLWFAGVNNSYCFLEIKECLCGGELTEGSLEDGQSMFSLSPPHGYNIGEGSAWVMDSGGSKLLWLPPNWRTTSKTDVRWDGDFLALLHSHHPEPVVIKFKPNPNSHTHV